MSRFIRAAAVASVLLGLPLSAPAFAHDQLGDSPTATRGAIVETTGSGLNMRFVKNLQYDKTGGAQSGSDIEFVRVGDRDYALAGTLRKGLKIIDITRPRRSFIAATYDCKVSQGDIQVWRNAGRIYASYTADGTVGSDGAASRCGRDLKLKASDAGTVIVDLSTPTKPQSVSFLSVPAGSHNMTIHPSGRYLYNSNSDLLTAGTEPFITIYDISRPQQPKKVQDFPIPFMPTSLGSESHDISFSADGTRAYSAALSQTLVLDTTDPRNPQLIAQIVDPAVNVSHQAEPIVLRREDGTRRKLLIVTDERAGAVGSVECPGGGLHLYDITGANETAPVKIGTWFIPVVQPQSGATCTSHVLRLYPRQKLMTIAWYSQGVRVLDLSQLADYDGSVPGIGLGDGAGLKEIGHYVFSDSDTWSFKTNWINRDGSFYGYGNDITRGFDVYRFSKPGMEVPALRPKDWAQAAPTRTVAARRLAGAGLIAIPVLVGAALVRRRVRD